MDEKAEKLGASEIGVSNVKSKRFYVVYNSKRINFGSKTGLTFIDHHYICEKSMETKIFKDKK